jgi:hypothetical protein
MFGISEGQAQAHNGRLPSETLAFLRNKGVPEAVEFRGCTYAFNLHLEPLLDGNAFRVGSVEQLGYAIALRRESGHFGHVDLDGEPCWMFCNTSLERFLVCFEATQRLWEMEAAGQIAWSDRGEHLAREIGRIDPAALEDPESPWAFLVEELHAGVV